MIKLSSLTNRQSTSYFPAACFNGNAFVFRWIVPKLNPWLCHGKFLHLIISCYVRTRCFCISVYFVFGKVSESLLTAGHGNLCWRQVVGGSRIVFIFLCVVHKNPFQYRTLLCEFLETIEFKRKKQILFILK